MFKKLYNNGKWTKHKIYKSNNFIKKCKTISKKHLIKENKPLEIRNNKIRHENWSFRNQRAYSHKKNALNNQGTSNNVISKRNRRFSPITT